MVKVVRWLWVCALVGACASSPDVDPRGGAGGTAGGGLTACPDRHFHSGRLSGSCNVAPELNCLSGHEDCVLNGRPTGFGLYFRCVDGMWRRAPTGRSCLSGRAGAGGQGNGGSGAGGVTGEGGDGAGLVSSAGASGEGDTP
jgi:hypothetical protein